MIAINDPEVILREARAEAFLRGPPWIFPGAIAAVKGSSGPGHFFPSRFH